MSKEMILKKIITTDDTTIKQALKMLDEASQRTLFIVDDAGVLIGCLSDGDVRRAILSGKQLDESIKEIYNKNPIMFEKSKFDKEEALQILLQMKIFVLPIIDRNGFLVDFVTWDELMEDSHVSGTHAHGSEVIKLPVVIMAGGKGTRMAPFTNILPKPLMPIGEKTVLEKIIDSFTHYGVNQFYFTVNYRGEMIKAYFDSIAKNYDVNYIWEKEFLGTVGCLKSIEQEMKSTFIVSNCDIMVRADYLDVLDFHRTNNSILTIVSSIQYLTVPYGVVNFTKGGRVTGVSEKPEYSFSINTGVYILEPSCFKYIPKDKFFHMTNLIEVLLQAGERVCTYPVNEKDYVDIGQLEEYKKALNLIS